LSWSTDYADYADFFDLIKQRVVCCFDFFSIRGDERMFDLIIILNKGVCGFDF